MPRTTAAIIRSKIVDTKMQAIVRSERSHLERSTKNCRKSPRKPAKTRGSYLPEPKVLRIQQRYINGQNKSEIAKAEGCDRETVARIVQFPEVRNFVAEMQQQFYGLVPDAMAALRYALQVEMDAPMGYRVLEATGVAPHQGERLQVPETTSSETGIERQARLVAAVLLASHENFDIALPKEIEEALVEDSWENTEGAKTAQSKLPRR